MNIDTKKFKSQENLIYVIIIISFIDQFQMLEFHIQKPCLDLQVLYSFCVILNRFATQFAVSMLMMNPL